METINRTNPRERRWLLAAHIYCGKSNWSFAIQIWARGPRHTSIRNGLPSHHNLNASDAHFFCWLIHIFPRPLRLTTLHGINGHITHCVRYWNRNISSQIELGMHTHFICCTNIVIGKANFHYSASYSLEPIGYYGLNVTYTRSVWGSCLVTRWISQYWLVLESMLMARAKIIQSI